MKKLSLLILGLLATSSLWSCQSDESDLKALVNILLVDSPAKWDSVFVEFEGVELQVQVTGRESEVQTFFLPYTLGDKVIEVSELVAGKAILLGRDELPIGKILGVSLKLGTDHSLYYKGERYPLPIQSAKLTPVLLRKTWELEQGISYDLILDFDLEKSIEVRNQTPLSFELKPFVRAFSAIGTGELKGSIEPSTLRPALYVINQSDTLSTHVNSTGSFSFRLPPGIYTFLLDSKDERYKSGFIPNVEIVSGKSTDLTKITILPN